MAKEYRIDLPYFVWIEGKNMREPLIVSEFADTPRVGESISIRGTKYKGNYEVTKVLHPLTRRDGYSGKEDIEHQGENLEVTVRRTD